jgi:protein-disulfide isomerase
MTAQAQSGSGSDASRDQMKQEIVQEVIDELRNSDALQDAVREGIHQFIEEQRQAQADAQRQQQQQANRQAAENVRPVSLDRDHVYGNPDAPVSLIEYSDFECPYCKRFHFTARELVDSSDGQVNWVYRHFPLSFHNPGAQQQAEASECAAELGGNDGFWAFTDTIYERTSSGGKGFPSDQLVPLAVEVGLDETAFRECLESGRYEERVKEDLAEGVRAGVSGTPGNIFLHNETGEVRTRAGAQPIGELRKAVEELMADAGEE